MAKKIIRKITLSIETGALTGLFSRFRGRKKEFDFSGISVLRQLLSNERARILTTIKNKHPESIYQLAKILGRDFKSVRQDVKLLEKLGIVELDSKIKGKREMLKPLLTADTISITLEI